MEGFSGLDFCHFSRLKLAPCATAKRYSWERARHGGPSPGEGRFPAGAPPRAGSRAPGRTPRLTLAWLLWLARHGRGVRGSPAEALGRSAGCRRSSAVATITVLSQPTPPTPPSPAELFQLWCFRSARNLLSPTNQKRGGKPSVFQLPFPSQTHWADTSEHFLPNVASSSCREAPAKPVQREKKIKINLILPQKDHK